MLLSSLLHFQVLISYSPHVGNENCSSLFHPNEREGGRKLVLDKIILEEGEGRGQEERRGRKEMS